MGYLFISFLYFRSTIFHIKIVASILKFKADMQCVLRTQREVINLFGSTETHEKDVASYLLLVPR